MSENGSFNGRLDTWKEIAAYLNRDVRTVIRWQKNGLPVHRVPGGQRQAVFAYRDELDAWLVSQEKDSVPSPAGILPREVQSPVAPKGRHWKWVFLACACVLSMVWGIMLLVARSHALPVRAFSSLRPLTQDGHNKAGLKTDGTTLYFNEMSGLRTVLVSAPLSGSPIRTIDTPLTNPHLQDLSHDGWTLLVTEFDGLNHEGALWAVSVQDGASTRVGDAVCSVARWSPDDRRIACAVSAKIVVMDADGSNLRPAGTFSAYVAQIQWSPDGQKLRFALHDIVNHRLSPWEMAIGSAEITGPPLPAADLPQDGTCCLEWARTPDGKNLGYVTMDAGDKAHLMMQDGAGQATEVPVEIGDLLGVAARNGNEIFLQIRSGDRGELLRYDTKQKNALTFLHGISAAYLSFSPDGKWIAYTNSIDNSLWRSRSDGSEARQLTGPSMQVNLPAWSPDGRQIAFMGWQPGKPHRIYLIDRNGGPAAEASEGSDNQGAPSWSPDGKELVYGNVLGEETHDGCIRRINLATRKVEDVPGSQDFRTARWSPDGRHVAALRWRTGELMLFDFRTGQWKVAAGDITGDDISWSSDSQFVYADSPRQKNPVVRRVRISDGKIETITNLAPFQKMAGQVKWLGLTPDNSSILLHLYPASEVYALDWTDR